MPEGEHYVYCWSCSSAHDRRVAGAWHSLANIARKVKYVILIAVAVIALEKHWDFCVVHVLWYCVFLQTLQGTVPAAGQGRDTPRQPWQFPMRLSRSLVLICRMLPCSALDWWWYIELLYGKDWCVIFIYRINHFILSLVPGSLLSTPSSSCWLQNSY